MTGVGSAESAERVQVDMFAVQLEYTAQQRTTPVCTATNYIK